MKAQQLKDDILGRLPTERAFFKTLGTHYPPHPETSVSQVTIAGTPCYWFLPQEQVDDKVIIYLHGGAFALGGIESHRAMVSHFAAVLKRRMLFVDYSLAPEFTYPVALNQIVNVYNEVEHLNPDAEFILMGDSAGGALALCTWDVIRNAGYVDPKALVLISPLVDFRFQGNSYHSREALDPILSKEYVQAYVELYNPHDLLAADPGQINYRGIPPVCILVGSREVLFDDGFNLYLKASQHQSNSVFKEYAEQMHVWPMTQIDSDESVAAMQDIYDFLKRLAE